VNNEARTYYEKRASHARDDATELISADVDRCCSCIVSKEISISATSRWT
jgi:hypothetical protein